MPQLEKMSLDELGEAFNGDGTIGTEDLWDEAIRRLTRFDALVAATRELADAAFARDISIGDPCSLLAAKDRLARAVTAARAVLASF